MTAETLLSLIAERSPPEKVGEIQDAVLNMVCNESQPIPLGIDEIYRTLKSEGEFLVVRMDYEEAAAELEEKRLEEKLSEARSLLVTFEVSGEPPAVLEEFIKYVHDRLDPLQSFRFGIKRVTRGGASGVTMLFGGILPVNQLRIVVGPGIEKLLCDNETVLRSSSLRLREKLSREIGAPLLPLRRSVGADLPPDRAKLVDGNDGSVLCEFSVEELTPSGLEIYLHKLYLALATLAKGKKARPVTLRI